MMTFTNTNGIKRKVLHWYGDVRAEVRRLTPPLVFSDMDMLFFDIFYLMYPMRMKTKEEIGDVIY